MQQLSTTAVGPAPGTGPGTGPGPGRQAERAFLHRVVEFLDGAGIRQYLFIGPGGAASGPGGRP